MDLLPMDATSLLLFMELMVRQRERWRAIENDSFWWGMML